MQLIPRYLVKDRILVVSNDVGFAVEYRPVYSRTVKVYRGVSNKIQFRMLNADQKPVTLLNAPHIVIFDENQVQVLDRECVVQDDGSTAATRGMFYVTINENDLLDIKQQYLHYNIYVSEAGIKTVTYANRNFDSAGIMYLDSLAYPGAKSPMVIENFFLEQNSVWVAGSDNDVISGEPWLNGNTALHTAAVYTNNYVGNIEIQVTLQDQLNGLNNWATVQTLTFDGTETEPVPVNFNGVFSFIRFKADADPTGKITKILLRN